MQEVVHRLRSPRQRTRSRSRMFGATPPIAPASALASAQLRETEVGSTAAVLWDDRLGKGWPARAGGRVGHCWEGEDDGAKGKGELERAAFRPGREEQSFQGIRRRWALFSLEGEGGDASRVAGTAQHRPFPAPRFPRLQPPVFRPPSARLPPSPSPAPRGRTAVLKPTPYRGRRFSSPPISRNAGY